jgi:phosphoribosylamine--glycine ligase
LVALARAEAVDLAIVGPEAPLAAGLADALRAAGVPAFGPSREAAEIETSKSFAKRLLLEAGIPTARASAHTDPATARRALRELGAPVVIKATGLAAGKGVVVAGSTGEAESAIDAMLRDHSFGEAGAEVLVEEFMEGEELSLFAITDGSDFRIMLPVQDHKRLLDGDLGPNTGGMGAYAPASIGSPAMVAEIERRIIGPTLEALREHGRSFRGLLYAGLMLTKHGPKVVEFNARFGDPETEAILPLMESHLLDYVLPVARGESLRDAPKIAWRRACAATTVVASAGYPEASGGPRPLVLPPSRDETIVFHAGTSAAPDGRLHASGGRVLAITAVASTLADAQQASLEAAEAVELDGKQFRRDIGWRELARQHARAP